MMSNPSFDQWWVSVHGWNWKANLSEEARDCAKEAWDAATIIQNMNKNGYLGFDVEDSSAYFDTSLEDQAMGKHTPGPWKAESDPLHYDTISTVVGGGKTEAYPYKRLIVQVGGSADWREQEANALLIAEAGTVATETGLTPRQLAEQRAKLLEALEGWIWARENGASEELAEQYARAAISKAKGETR